MRKASDVLATMAAVAAASLVGDPVTVATATAILGPVVRAGRHAGGHRKAYGADERRKTRIKIGKASRRRNRG